MTGYLTRNHRSVVRTVACCSVVGVGKVVAAAAAAAAAAADGEKEKERKRRGKNVGRTVCCCRRHRLPLPLLRPQLQLNDLDDGAARYTQSLAVHQH